MNLLRAGLRRFCIRSSKSRERLQIQKSPKPIGWGSSRLSKLPPELILDIVDFLPIEATTPFSLTCRRLQNLLGVGYVEKLKLRDFLQELTLQTLLEKVDYISCYHCQKSHPIKNDHLRARRHNCVGCILGSRGCMGSEEYYGINKYITYPFSESVFRKAMKRHRQGKDYADLLMLLSHERIYPKRICGTEHLIKDSSVVRVINGKLLIRTHVAHIARPGRKVRVNKLWYMCCHWRLIEDNPADSSFKLKKIWNDTGTIYPVDEDLMQCTYCQTECYASSGTLDSGHQAAFYTKWQDLGQGIWPADCRWDCQWKSHFTNIPGTCISHISFTPGSISGAFEQSYGQL
ncbi:hypothetical protein F5884DRAFT_497256 [Xylogone sp. PMI_703]|nr:hypothetical protein F5884DRAFT_497256 [Xylogone sp. PMI_703]